jgi:hypothetical protein
VTALTRETLSGDQKFFSGFSYTEVHRGEVHDIRTYPKPQLLCYHPVLDVDLATYCTTEAQHAAAIQALAALARMMQRFSSSGHLPRLICVLSVRRRPLQRLHNATV